VLYKVTIIYQRIENSLDDLIGELCMPPPVASVILDSRVDESWFEATDQLEQCILSLQPRSKLRASKDLSALTEGLRIVVGMIRSILYNLVHTNRRLQLD
jgi:hypothetical protein